MGTADGRRLAVPEHEVQIRWVVSSTLQGRPTSTLDVIVDIMLLG